MGTTINGKKFYNVGVMSVHNVSADFICINFKGPQIGELPINPTDNGITFFRWKRPTPRPNQTISEPEVRYFEALDKIMAWMRSWSSATIIAMTVWMSEPV